ncbi:MAG: hypothetical protein EU532_04815 [Promethearchaeota archaeon]|nr:MAG: hypothetical protein EU532_04815 [Candidatus Lokiarchaeota archaeon]
MDTGIDFIQPEFLNILFFQQKNLVIFPYVDLKHLHALEIFTVGHNIIDLESTALYNLKEIIEFETNNSYSQNYSLFFIYNLNREKISEILEMSGIRCILNTNDKVSDLVKDDAFIFYNKKNKTFLNYNKIDVELDFEKYLINSSENETILYERIQHIKILATKIFNEINKNPNSYEYIPEILKEYEMNYWERILNFTKLYFNIEIPNLNFTQKKYLTNNCTYNNNAEQNAQFVRLLNEYQYLTSINKHVTNEFIQTLHHYRSLKVNPRYLDMEQLYHPQKIYVYLRTHHWKDKIDTEFFKEWIQMRITGHKLTEQDITDFEKICDKFQLPKTLLMNISMGSSEAHIIPVPQEDDFINKSDCPDDKKTLRHDIENLPSIQNYNAFKYFFLKRLDQIDQMISEIKNSK